MSNCPLESLKNLRNSQAIQARLQWLEDRIYWVGELNRSDLAARFEMTPQQATKDITLYQELAAQNLAYDGRRKVYVKGAAFEPLFPKDQSAWLKASKDEPGANRPLPNVSVKPIKRGMTDDVLMAIARSFRLRLPLSILYLSGKATEPKWRVICPHTVVETEIRWHIRAYIVDKGKFSDLIPGRILQVEDNHEVEWVDVEADDEWNTFADIVLVPSASQSEQTKLIAKRDYNMVNDEVVLPVRECLVYYQLSAMYLVDAVREHEGEPQDRNFGVAVKNWKELMRFVKDC